MKVLLDLTAEYRDYVDSAQGDKYFEIFCILPLLLCCFHFQDSLRSKAECAHLPLVLVVLLNTGRTSDFCIC